MKIDKRVIDELTILQLTGHVLSIEYLIDNGLITKATLDALEKANYILIMYDDNRSWATVKGGNPVTRAYLNMADTVKQFEVQI